MSAAIDPAINTVVQAAAGTGKTWLLVSRLVRLLLEGATPSSILAITFTRRAAAEMRVRLNQRLLDMCEASDNDLRAMLQTLDLAPTAATLARARGLYEELLLAPRSLRVTTFHAFCQELLARFAFDAGIPPGFEIIEQTRETEEIAWRLLDRDLTSETDDVTQALERLLAKVGVDNTREALNEFLAHRSDWWAYTEDHDDPIAHALRQLQLALDIDPTRDPTETFAADGENRKLVVAILERLARETPASLKPMVDSLQDALRLDRGAEFYERVRDALYVQDKKKPREFKIPKGLGTLLGPAQSEALTRDHRALLERLQRAEEICKRHATWARNRDWYLVGARLLDHFQAQKRAAGVLDFADLEWLAYRLLTRSRYAEWVQYKLDQRVDHLLVDEFQDTNPTQWRLLLPLLQEMAAGSSERQRSVFLVGDDKQSIYRFRRADPALFALARDWLIEQSGARVHDLDISWRSSPAIVRFVNLLFDGKADMPEAFARDYRLPGFRTHQTHRQNLWGHAELLPLIVQDAPSAASAPFRDPLEQPRVVEEDQRRRREGNMIAQKIHSLIGRPIRDGDVTRAIGYGDIMILLRTRTYAGAYETALREAGIPYAGAGRGNFLDCLEVRDILDLLQLLVSPFENVSAAAVLRSPIFGASDEDLLALAALDADATWYDRLMRLNSNAAALSPPPLAGEGWGGGSAGGRTRIAETSLARAAHLLADWRNLADRVPVHDLLDRIYYDADLPQRYEAAAPTHLRARVAANLTRLLDLALEADGGRFPSLARFLSRLELLTEEDNESLGAGSDAVPDQVRLLTIHGAKGLESPVVFLVDAARDAVARDRGPEVLVDWPIAATRPAHFLLAARGSEADGWSRPIVDRHAAEAFQEETNLLYVALTRARQYLFVSGCESGRRKNNGSARAGDETRGWYGYIERRFAQAQAEGRAASLGLQLSVPATASDDTVLNLCGSIAFGEAPALAPTQAPLPLGTPIDPALTRPFETPRPKPQIESTEDADESALLADAELAALTIAEQRGIVIHRMLERLTEEGADRERAKQQVQHEFAARMDADLLTECWTEACAVVDSPDLRRFFDPQQYKEARNEVAVLYRTDEREVTGIIDRLVFYDDRLVLIDYKTHSAAADQLSALVERYTPQLRLYAEGLRRLWPGRQVEAVLVFTAARRNVVVKV